MSPPYRIIVACSFGVLSFEILLIRIFSIRLSYHYASLIISLSMTGLVIGGVTAFFRQRTSHHQSMPPFQPAQRLAAAIAVSCPAVFILLSTIPLDHVRMLWEKAQIVYLGLFILLCTIPFFFYGVFISSALSAWSTRANRVYASDLLGGAAGLLATVVFMNIFRIEYIVVAFAVAVGSVVISEFTKPFSKICLGLILLALCLPVLAGKFPLAISPYKGLMQALKDDDARHVETIYSSHSRLDLFENPRTRIAPGLSLAFTKPVPRGIGMALDGDVVGAVMEWDNLKSYDFLSYMPSALPYILGEPESVVVIGAKSNIDLLLPAYFRTPCIHAAEHDASVLRFFNTHQKDQSGSPPVPIFEGSGRSLLKSLPRKHGLVFLSKTGFFPSGQFGLQEDYDLTSQAIEAYTRTLQDDGILFIQTYLLPPPRLELRLAANIAAALKRMGIQETWKHLVIYRSWDTINYVVKRDSFSGVDLEKISRFLVSRQFDLLYPDTVGQAKFIAGLNYSALFHQILNTASSAGFISSYPFDIRETTDDRPFLYYFLKPGKIGEVYELSGKKWIYFLHEGMFLPFTLFLLICLSLAVFFAVSLVSSKSGFKQRTVQKSTFKPLSLAYFISIGFAFMFVEVYFVHRLMLSFGSPASAFSTTLVTTLLCAGFGSLAAAKAMCRKTVWVISLAPLLIIMCWSLFDVVKEVRISAAMIVPAGIVMGLFFPSGLRYLLNDESDNVPLAYAANGAASIIAPSLASFLAVTYGCNLLLILAAILYAVATAIILPVAYRTPRSVEDSRSFQFES